MKILAVADVEDRALGEHFDPERWRGVDLILSLGDLKPDYLDYLVSRLNVRCLYVRGNHDAAYGQSPPAGCDDVNGRVVKVDGLRIAGLEGSRWYGGSGVEYSDRHTALRAFLLDLRIRLAGGVDVLMTHAPPTFGDPALDDALDKVHAGFDSYRKLALAHQPRLFLHGHTHLNYGRNKREQAIGSTRVIDCYGATLIELGPLPSRRAAA
jgi:Icc-related predicted phosphoesterase